MRIHLPPAGAERSRGFSLLELLIVIGISTLMTVALAAVVLSYGKSADTQTSTIDVASSASAIINAVQLAGLQADAVVASHNFAGTLYTSGANTVVFELPSIDSTGTLIAGAHDYVALSSSGSNAVSITDANPSSDRASVSKTLSRTLYSLTFSYDTVDPIDARAVTAAVHTRAVTRQKTVETQLSYKVFLRNAH